jgi:acetyl-CoA carboxylase biotin carboxylase subunit
VELGFPVFIKSVSGGGGRGMRLVKTSDDFRRCFEAAQTESLKSSGNDEMYIEKFIPNCRHIEFQVIGDGTGNVIHLGERECSVQRRFQKIIEESPSPFIDSEMRDSIGSRIAESLGRLRYNSLGTVELLVDEQRRWYFMEMNTRLQVEHPVTEMVTGIDLVRWQIEVAASKPFILKQEKVNISGHAIECRINAEKANTLLPVSGKITRFIPPGGHGTRIDSSVTEDCEINAVYDSLIAKVITHAENRQLSIMKMRRAMDEFVIEGVETNIQLHRKILGSEQFVSGRFDTAILSRIL